MSSETQPRDLHAVQRPQRDLFGVKLLGAISIFLVAAIAGAWMIAKKPWQFATTKKRGSFSVISNEPRLTPHTNELYLPSKAQTSSLAPRLAVDTSGFSLINSGEVQWAPDASLSEIARTWAGWANRTHAKVDQTACAAGARLEAKTGSDFHEGGTVYVGRGAEESIDLTARGARGA